MSGALLVLVTGHPASGKSTLAGLMAKRLRLPVLAKDDLQEALFEAGLGPPQSGACANLAMLGLARRLLGDGLDCVIDSNLDPQRWHHRLQAVLERSAARLLQVRCRADPAMQLERFTARVGRRHAGHRDGERLGELRARLLGAPLAAFALPGPVLEHDSTRADPAALRAVLDAVRDARRRD